MEVLGTLEKMELRHLEVSKSGFAGPRHTRLLTSAKHRRCPDEGRVSWQRTLAAHNDPRAFVA